MRQIIIGDILILGKEPTGELGDTIITMKAKICLNLQYNAANSFFFYNDVRIYQFKAKTTEIKLYQLCFGNTSKDCTVNNMKKKRFEWKNIQFFY